jgi:hypothetical protein
LFGFSGKVSWRFVVLSIPFAQFPHHTAPKTCSEFRRLLLLSFDDATANDNFTKSTWPDGIILRELIDVKPVTAL